MEWKGNPKLTRPTLVTHLFDSLGNRHREEEGVPKGTKLIRERTHTQPSYSDCGCVHAKLLQSCLTLCNAMDCRLPGFSVHGILQARILEWVAMLFSRGCS